MHKVCVFVGCFFSSSFFLHVFGFDIVEAHKKNQTFYGTLVKFASHVPVAFLLDRFVERIFFSLYLSFAMFVRLA